MSEYFKNIDTGSNLIPPDYSKDDDDDVEDLDESIDIDEEDEIDVVEPHLEKVEEENKKEKEKENMGNTSNGPFGTPVQSPWAPATGGSTWGSSWGGTSNSTPSFGGFGSQPSKPAFGGFGSQPSWGQQNSQREPINRNKKVIFIPFLDGIVETYESRGGRPGLPPRDIYDLTPRFAVWEKIGAFNPVRVYPIVPINVLSSTNGDHEAWDVTLGYYCCCLSAFLRLPYDRCLAIAQPTNGQPTSKVIKTVLRGDYSKITKEEVVYLGNYSGVNGLSDVDLKTAEECGIDYIDITQLLTSMF